MKRRSKCISIVIAKTASRNVAFKSAKLAKSVFAGQSDVLTRQAATEVLSSDEADLEYLGRNADLYIFNRARLRLWLACFRYMRIGSASG